MLYFISNPIKNGSTALIEAASEGHDEIVNFLLTNGAKVDQTDKVSAMNVDYKVPTVDTYCINYFFSMYAA